ncbi:rubrerythrin [Candidatus Poribacteria bacterium]|nr:rubrerythrin [Candidatus Poribacteria bacterium]
MKEFGSVDELLDFAVKNEEEAFQFYTDLAGKSENPHMRQVFEELAREEVGHKAKLIGIKKGKLLMPAKQKIIDLKIADYLVDVEPDPKKLDYQGALILAMKNEKAAFKLYTDLAETTDDEELAATLLAFAQEEAKHKLKLEIEYDEHVLKYN